ncbi:type I-F CRISPR-associated protein Csy1 [Carnimonas nigrificans]|uniref:type I-F CRISPR-associated protein Csy1 n=1 Tax=Carnimonas nigrificans TaxID=64323 RepID=UPI0004B96BE2|nr:type I-F CRISPR-associated protein Csy1 [Carnimonas nigrificans]
MSASVASIRQLVDSFINDRFNAKVEKLSPDDPKYLKLQEQFEPQTWIADAARRVSQLQVVTHSLKAIHPDAKGTNLYVEPGKLAQLEYVGSHCLSDGFKGDVVGNAAALDVYKFLRLEWEGKTLLERSLTRDQELIRALSPKQEEGETWVNAFAGIVESKGTPCSHAMGKQLYWLVDQDPTQDSNYVMLAPLYPTALIHPFHIRLSEARFGEHAKQGRKARRENKYFEGEEYADYPDLVVQKLGGTKPQNISQLNSERGGQNYLLASLPPQWQSRSIYPPTRDAFRSFGRRPIVRRTVHELKYFLESGPRKNMGTRDWRDDFTTILIDELMLFTFDMHSLPAGWSADEKNQLSDTECYWLDPGRVEQDSDFAEARRLSDWHQAVSDRAALWLNKALNRKNTLKLADTEHRHWKSQFEETMKDFRRQLDDLQAAVFPDEEHTEEAL